MTKPSNPRGQRVPTREHRYLGAACLASALLLACHGAHSSFPWPGSPPAARDDHAYVHTLNPGYDRLRSHVLVREVGRATRATLDYAAYHANFMIADAPPESEPPPAQPAKLDRPFAGLLDAASLTSDIRKTGLTAAERGQALAFAPLSEYLLARKIPGAERLEELGAAVRAESWGQRPIPGSPSQTPSEVFLHHRAGGATELWIKLEFAPWFHALGKLPDQDHDGVAELYARARKPLPGPELIAAIEHDYAGRELTAAEIKLWANQLSSYWYPSFNTDLVPAPKRWPDAQTEAAIQSELGGHGFDAPTIVLRGKPQGRPTYDVLLIRGGSSPAATASAHPPAAGPSFSLPTTKPTPDVQSVARTIADELERHGAGSWAKWARTLAPFHAAVRHKLAATPSRIQALPGDDGFLFYRKSLQALVAGDLELQPAGKNPLPVIVEYKDKLAALGVDFLFVPVPSKAEVFPDRVDPRFAKLAGQIVNPWPRKLLQSLAAHGVEVVDLLPAFLADRASSPASPEREPLFQHQDTHWSARGLELAAALISARIRSYPWYAALSAHAQPLQSRATSFTRFGDLHSRLPEASQRRYRPETLAADRVVRADGSAYEDDPQSPIVVLGDSFTGVYELTDAEHAGLSAHIAREISFPVDLVMSYGGGPNVRNKLMKRGQEDLARKRLVIWVMAARDLHDYWEDWEPLNTP